MTMARWRPYVAALALLATLPLLAAERDDVFEGTWQGTLTLVARRGQPPAGQEGSMEIPVSLKVRGRNVRAEFNSQQIGRGLGWPLSELPGSGSTGVRMESHDAAALIYFAQTTGEVIHTWQMSVTKIEADKLLVFFWRVVNFKRGDPANDRSKPAVAFVGELSRPAAE